MVQLSKLLNCGYRRPEVQQIKGWRFHINSFTMYGKMNMVFIYAGAFAGYCAYKKFSKPAVSKIYDKKAPVIIKFWVLTNCVKKVHFSNKLCLLTKHKQ